MANKPINKQYLKDTLLRFKEQVLNNEYARRTDIVEGHTHSNKETLDKFSEFSDGTLFFIGKILGLICVTAYGSFSKHCSF